MSNPYNPAFSGDDRRMHISHVAIWSRDLESLKAFYVHYFEARPGELYENPRKHFISCFLSFTGGARLELMQKTLAQTAQDSDIGDRPGYAHVAMAVGSKEAVDELCSRLRADGVTVVDGPRWTGDRYYECVVLDPDGNLLEITI